MGAYSSNMQTSIKLALGLCLLLALTNFASAAEPVEAKHLGKCSEHVTPAENDGPYCTASWCSYCCEDDGCNTCKYQCKKGEPAFGELTPSEERKKNGATNNQLPNWRDMPMSEEEEELQKDAVVPEKLPYIDSESASAPPPPEPTNPWDDGIGR